MTLSLGCCRCPSCGDAHQKQAEEPVGEDGMGYGRDIVERLRERAFDWCDSAQESMDEGATGGYELSTASLINDAIEEIERLRGKNE